MKTQIEISPLALPLRAEGQLILDATERIIAATNDSDAHTEIIDAAEIVRRVNGWDEILAALEALTRKADGSGWAEYQQARGALGMARDA